MNTPPHNLGNVNLKGKKEKIFRCGCCSAYDLRDKLLKKIHKEEIRNGGREADSSRLLNDRT